VVVQGRTVVGARGSQQALTAGCTPLHAAAFRGDLGIVQAMLQVKRRGSKYLSSGPPTTPVWHQDGEVSTVM
jgi:hypothetical protein